MNVSLARKLERLIIIKVESGLYNSASEVVRECIRLSQHSDEMGDLKLAAIRNEIQKVTEATEKRRVVDCRKTLAEKKGSLLKMTEGNR